MASEGAIVLSYHDTLLRQSDVDLLKGNHWINDNIITFWFEYLEHDLYQSESEEIVLVAPQVGQFIKSAMGNPATKAELPVFLDAIGMGDESKRIILIPISDEIVPRLTPGSDSSSSIHGIGGSHWSLLVYFRETDTFEHFDSFSGSVNHVHAKQVVECIKPLISLEPMTEISLNEMECTQQSNGYDCGIHVIVNAEAILRQMFRGAEEHIIDIASNKAVNETRLHLLQLIEQLKRKENN